MKAGLIIAFVLVSGCATPEQRHRNEIIDDVEKTVILPKEAGSMKRYSRFYTQDKNEHVIGIYVAEPYDTLPTGKRRWVEDVNHLPDVSDGGCYVFNVIYNLRKRKVTMADCNGIG